MRDPLCIKRDHRPVLSCIALEHAEGLEPCKDITGHGSTHTKVAGKLEFVDPRSAEHGPVNYGALNVLVDTLPGRLLADWRWSDVTRQNCFEISHMKRSRAITDNMSCPIELSDQAIVLEATESLPYWRPGSSEQLDKSALADYGSRGE